MLSIWCCECGTESDTAGERQETARKGLRCCAALQRFQPFCLGLVNCTPYHTAHQAAAKGQLLAIELLLTYGADVDSHVYGCTPLGNAVENGQVSCQKKKKKKKKNTTTLTHGREIGGVRAHSPPP